MVEMVDTRDLKSLGVSRAGSIPALGITLMGLLAQLVRAPGS